MFQKRGCSFIICRLSLCFVTQETFESFSECCFDHCLKVERTFNCKGGTLWSRNSDMRINVDPGTIPIGSTQTLFSRIIYDERPLLGKLPEGPDRTLISPVFECGPSGILLQKPVEIVVPHCLSDPSNHDTIQVFRCDHQGSFPNAGNGARYYRLQYETPPLESR